MRGRAPAEAPRWLRELAEGCRYGAAMQSPSLVSQLVHAEASARGLAPEELARMVAREWVRQGLVTSTALPLEEAG